jgi:hypothetical protein
MKVKSIFKYRLIVDTSTLSEKARSYITQHEIALQPHTLNLDYNFWTAGTIPLFTV